MLSKVLGFSLILSFLAIPVNAQLSEKDVTDTWHRGAFQWVEKKQFASYQFLGKGAEFAVGYIYPNSATQWDYRMPSLITVDCKSLERTGGWIVSEGTREKLRKDSTKHFEDANQFANDFCTTHKSVYPEAAIYKGIEM